MGWGERYQHFSQYVKCGREYVDSPPTNEEVHEKYMAQLRKYKRVEGTVEKYEEDPKSNSPPKDSDGYRVTVVPM